MLNTLQIQTKPENPIQMNMYGCIVQRWLKACPQTDAHPLFSSTIMAENKIEDYVFETDMTAN